MAPELGMPEVGDAQGDPVVGTLFRKGSRSERRGGRFSMGEIAIPQSKPGAAAETRLRVSPEHGAARQGFGFGN